MKVSRILTFIVLLTVLLTASATVADADHEGYDHLFEWVTHIAEDEEYYGIKEPYAYFSGDEETLDRDDLYDKENTEFENNPEQAFYKLGDYTVDKPPEAVHKWNNGNYREFPDEGVSDTVFPQNRVHESNLKNGALIKDAYTTFFAITPSTTIHYSPSSRDDRTDDTQYRVGRTADIYVLQDARTEPPEYKTFEDTPSKKAEHEVSNYDIVYSKLYTTTCPNGASECIIGYTDSDDERVKFEDIAFKRTGPQLLRVESKFEAQYEITVSEREWECEKTELPKVDLDGDGELEQAERGKKPPEGYPDTRGWECEWTEWQPKQIYETGVDEVVVEQSMPITVSEPRITAKKAVLPGGQIEYHLSDLDHGEWSRIVAGRNGEETTVLQSSWRFFSSRDGRWDKYCTTNGVDDGAATEDCGGRLNDASHYPESAASRPLLTHAIPSKQGVKSPDSDTSIMQSFPVSQYRYPYLEQHKTCMGTCNWIMMGYQEITPGESTYPEPGQLVIRRAGDTEYLRAYGLVRDASRDVEIESSRNVKLAEVSFETMYKGSEIPDNRRLRPELPEDDEFRVKVSLYEAKSGDSINLKNRDDEYVVVSDGETTYWLKPGSDGVVSFNLPESDETYTVSYEARSWWNVPKNEQAYIPYGELTRDPSVQDETYPVLQQLFVLLGILMIPAYIMMHIFRMMGIEVKWRDFWKLFKIGGD